ncbi:HrpB1 family type III secretion system apparatus protein [Paraburkholderia bannensis]|uniref:HrpB1 family type III secretion system apparatus protein n=1 Tax=Paraburkholderia bannensis TaxID=765414 RepID=UPI002AC32ADB|nr:HrpB1 family type III secretion system apparatus protein [Paraburkholderia bannensis]
MREPQHAKRARFMRTCGGPGANLSLRGNESACVSSLGGGPVRLRRIARRPRAANVTPEPSQPGEPFDRCLGGAVELVLFRSFCRIRNERAPPVRPLPPGGNVLNLTACPDKLVSALIELLVTSVNKGYLDESERLLAALQLMRPRFRELQVYDAWIFIARKQFHQAAQILRTLETQTLQQPFNAYVSALMAICLFSIKDPSWRIFANEVLARNEDSESIALVNLLMGNKPEPRVSDTPDQPRVQQFSQSHFLRA